MGILITNTYYREPDVIVKGKYNRLVTIKKIIEIVTESKLKYHERLEKIEITYDKKKDGIIVKPICVSEEDVVNRLSLKKRPSHERSVIFFSKTAKEDAEKYYLYKDLHTEKISTNKFA